MNATPTVSVILPLYRVKDYLAEAIASVRAQTFADWECLCLDDGSGNGMAELARELTAGDARFAVHAFPNAGVAATRNRGLDLARGAYVAFLDQDDAYHPRYLELLLGALRQTGAACVTCAWRSEPFAAGEPAPAAEPRLVENPCAWLLARGTATVAVWTKLWRHEALGGLRFEPSLRGSDDALFTYSAFARFGRVAVLDAALYFYRRHPAAVSVRNPPSYLLANLRFVALLPAVLPPLPRRVAAKGQLRLLANFCKLLRRSDTPLAVQRALLLRVLAIMRRNGLSVWGWSLGKRRAWWRLCRRVGLAPTVWLPRGGKTVGFGCAFLGGFLGEGRGRGGRGARKALSGKGLREK